MTKSKNTKRALLTSMLSMLLCVSMLIGSTYAWFTDSVTSGMNKIVAGNLDVELEYSTDMKTWEEVDEKTDMFKEATASTDALWEPGYTKVVYLHVTNAGTLALKYKLGVYAAKVVLGTSVDGKPINLADYIKFGVVEDVETPYSDRAEARKAVEDSAVLLSHGYASDEETTLEKDGTSKTLALVVYMPEEVGNEANYRGEAIPEVELGLNLVATQATVESDSFDKNYDKDANYPEVSTSTTTWYEDSGVGGGSGGSEPATTYTLCTAADLAGLAQLVNNGEDNFEGKTITLAGDIALDGVSNWIPIGTAENPFKGTFDGAGHTVFGLFIDHNLTTGLEAIGFFGHIEGAKVENLTVEGNITITDVSKIIKGDEFVAGGICAVANNSTISQCTNKVTIDISAVTEPNAILVGGILGMARDTNTTTTYITKCENNANLTAATTADTIVGGITSLKRLNKVIISECKNTGTLQGTLWNDEACTF